jgi:hypothetical protein
MQMMRLRPRKMFRSMRDSLQRSGSLWSGFAGIGGDASRRDQFRLDCGDRDAEVADATRAAPPLVATANTSERADRGVFDVGLVVDEILAVL